MLLVGSSLLFVESFVLNESMTRFLVHQFGAPSQTPQGVLQRFIVDTSSRQAFVTPPAWLRWLLLSSGLVLFAYAVMGRRWK